MSENCIAIAKKTWKLCRVTATNRKICKNMQKYQIFCLVSQAFQHNTANKNFHMFTLPMFSDGVVNKNLSEPKIALVCCVEVKTVKSNWRVVTEHEVLNKTTKCRFIKMLHIVFNTNKKHLEWLSIISVESSGAKKLCFWANGGPVLPYIQLDLWCLLERFLFWFIENLSVAQ